MHEASAERASWLDWRYRKDPHLLLLLGILNSRFELQIKFFDEERAMAYLCHHGENLKYSEFLFDFANSLSSQFYFPEVEA